MTGLAILLVAACGAEDTVTDTVADTDTVTDTDTVAETVAGSDAVTDTGSASDTTSGSDAGPDTDTDAVTDAGPDVVYGDPVPQFQVMITFGEDEEAQLAPHDPTRVLPAPRGGWYVAGWGGWDWSPRHYGFVMHLGPDGADDGALFFTRIAPNGDLVFETDYFSDYSVVRQVTEDTAGNVVAVGRDVNLIWDRFSSPTQRFAEESRRAGDGGGNWEASAVAATDDGGLLIAGRNSGGELWVLKADAEDRTGGCHVWDGHSRSFDSDNTPIVRDRDFTRTAVQLVERGIDTPLTTPVITPRLECSAP